MRPKNIKKHGLKKILLIGDTSLDGNLLLTPAIKKIKDAFPDASADIIVEKSSADFVVDNPLFSEYIIYDRKKNLLRLVKKARRKRYDLIIALRNPFLPFFIRGKFKLSFFWQDFFSEKTFTHESERMLNFLEPFVGREENKINFYLPVSKKHRDAVETRLKKLAIKNSDTLVIINPGFVPKEQKWQNSHYASVANKLIRTYGAKIIFTGSKDDKHIIRAVMDEVKNENTYDFSGQINLKELAALIEKADLLISQSNVPVYLACSVKCPVVAIFGPGNPYRFGPRGTKNLVVHSSLDCFPCNLHFTCNKNYMCLEKISPEQVLKSAMLLLDEKEQPLLFAL